MMQFRCSPAFERCARNLKATRFAPGRKNSLTLEVNGSAGSLVFDLEEMNGLRFYDARDPEERRGFRNIIVTEPAHPFMKSWWPPGHLIGYEHTFVHTVADFVQAVVARKSVASTFEDGLRNQRVLDAARASAETNSGSRFHGDRERMRTRQDSQERQNFFGTAVCLTICCYPAAGPSDSGCGLAAMDWGERCLGRAIR